MGNYLNGEFVEDGKKTKLVSPADGSEVATVVLGSRKSAIEAIDAADFAFHNTWVKTSIGERQKLLAKLATLVQEKSYEYARMESANTGKTMRQSTLMDIPLGISHIEYFSSTQEFKFSREITHPEYPDTTGIVQNAPMGLLEPLPHGMCPSSWQCGRLPLPFLQETQSF
jgi:acyl-CoA reductase-like NAD-dependent aldehyde dehydrogenase